MKPNSLKINAYARATACTSASIGAALLMLACSSEPISTILLDQTRMDLRAAQNNPAITTYAALELQQASEALVEADLAAYENRDATKVDALAYLAKQKIAFAQEVAKQKFAETSVTKAATERDQIRLAQRTTEADDANLRAAQSKQAARSAQEETTQAQMATAQAERQTQEAQQHALQLQNQLTELAAKTTERGIVITIGDVLFSSDHSSLTAEGMRSAQKLATLLKENPLRTVIVEGFTDSVGSSAYNQGLSERRATSVSNALQGLGVAASRITIHGYGESHPAAANNNAANRQLNRRVEIILSDDSGKIANR